MKDSPPFKLAGESALQIMASKYRVPNSVCKFALRSNDNYVHIFKETPKIAPYLYGLMAGPYVETVNSLPGSQKYVPMRAYCRKTVTKHFEPNEYFYPVMCGMSFYQKFFGHKFPFSKYDQIMVPEFNWGAMQNVGVVTFTESYLFRSPPTQSRRQGVSNTILHQLAHMWFGNLVTMFWWKDLWLNESFATFTSYLCQQLAGDELFNNDKSKVQPHDPWLPFINLKSWAYRTDTVSSTHPVAGEVKDTEEAENIFDGITYAKGSSFLKQFYHYISGEVFSAGLHIYFKRHQYGNTEFDDFLQAMQEAYDEHHKGDNSAALDIFAWAATWLRHTGTNSFEYKMEVSHEKISKFMLIQGFKQFAEEKYREQTIDVSFFDENCNQTVLRDIRINAQEITQVPEAIGMKQPSAVLINSNDWGYGLELYDEKSVKFWQAGNLWKVKSPVNRRLIWLHLFQFVKDAKMSAIKLIEIFERNILNESDQTIISSCFMYLHGQFGFLPFRVRDEYYTRIWTLIRKEMIPKWFQNKTPEGVNVMQTLISNLVEFTSTENELKIAQKWLQKTEPIIEGEEQKESLSFNEGQRRSLLRSIWGSVQISRADKQKLLDEELKGDESDKAELLQIYCEARQPDAGIKSVVWKRSCDKNDKRSLFVKRASMQGFQSWRQIDLLAVYCDKFFDEVLGIFEKCDRRIAEEFFYNLNPANYLTNKKTMDQLKHLLERVPESQKYLKKLVSDCIERLEVRKIAIDLVESEIK